MKVKRRTKIILIALLVVLALAGAVLGFAGNYLFRFALDPQMDGGMLDNNNQDMSDAGLWFLNHSEERWLTSRDGLRLHGYYLPQEEDSHKYAVICHGYGSEPLGMTGSITWFYDQGYNVLVPAARAHEQSEGRYAGMGWPERLDVVDWVNTLAEQDPQAQIALYGVSMGGATVMMASGEDLPDNVKCIIEDCGYSSVWDEFATQLDEMFGLPAFPLLNAASLTSKLRAGYSFEEASAVEQLKKATLPMLFIHGEEDAFVPYSMLELVFNACASAEKERLDVPGAAHAQSYRVDPELYWGTVSGFLEKYIES